MQGKKKEFLMFNLFLVFLTGYIVFLTMADFYFDEIIKVLKIDEQVVYDKLKGFTNDVSVTRIHVKIEDEDFDLELDVHSHFSEVRLLFVHSDKQKSLADKFEYVMHGLLYKMSEDGKKGKVRDDGSKDVYVVYILFGGLQLMLKGDPLKMHKFKPGQKLFLVLRKI
ncbi:hypothetical protein BUALT_Bualt07G0116000 [Buddleja alternifolia]|uniref:Uncharacterized protein n=1 Tax=Buddleja alternifolia TaxID=168488 RepID=A0AAV6XAZ2_9LAMI|nr:hypothetical protein BUALT_Bualt07G0116000 [Buddleja alternifolia]